MEVFRTVSDFRAWRRGILLQGKTIGLVPTMGALHAGHISLGKLPRCAVLRRFEGLLADSVGQWNKRVEKTMSLLCRCLLILLNLHLMRILIRILGHGNLIGKRLKH